MFWLYKEIVQTLSNDCNDYKILPVCTQTYSTLVNACLCFVWNANIKFTCNELWNSSNTSTFHFIYKYIVIMMNIHQYIQTDTVEDVKFKENQLNWI